MLGFLWVSRKMQALLIMPTKFQCLWTPKILNKAINRGVLIIFRKFDEQSFPFVKQSLIFSMVGIGLMRENEIRRSNDATQWAIQVPNILTGWKLEDAPVYTKGFSIKN
jgi:hypothetical protein